MFCQEMVETEISFLSQISIFNLESNGDFTS